MISINGRVFPGNNLKIVNGRIISSGGGTVRFQKFDERKVADCSNIDTIAIESSVVNINVSASNSSKVEAHLYGEANIDGDITLDVHIINRELRIAVLFTGNCFGGNLRLDVTIPRKTFKVISANSSSAGITLNAGVLTNYLKVKTKSGDLETNATVNAVFVSTRSGDVELCIDATQDINVYVSTMSGDVSAEFNNIGHINLSTSSMSGNVRNRHKGIRGYNADVEISTRSGDIRIR